MGLTGLLSWVFPTSTDRAHGEVAPPVATSPSASPGDVSAG
jgi:hypothetical protein